MQQLQESPNCLTTNTPTHARTQTHLSTHSSIHTNRTPHTVALTYAHTYTRTPLHNGYYFLSPFLFFLSLLSMSLTLSFISTLFFLLPFYFSYNSLVRFLKTISSFHVSVLLNFLFLIINSSYKL